MLLSKYREQAYRAYALVSFYPEQRADQVVSGYSEELENDLKNLPNPGNYQEKYEAHFLKWTEALSRCLSPMITGPANFPVARNEKARNAERRVYEEFRSWRERYFKAVNRVHTLSPEEEIDKTLEELDKAIIHHETMKGINAIIKNRQWSLEDKKQQIVEQFGWSEEKAEEVLKPDVVGYIGFESYTLTNSNARIKNMQEKLATMRARIEQKNTWEPLKFEGGLIDIENDRVVIRHDSKPAPEVIGRLKANGFRWSPHWKCWCRKHTARAVMDARAICGL